MLKFQINHQQKGYRIAFDVPIQASILLHEEFAKIIEGLSSDENFQISTNSQMETIGISGNYNTLLKLPAKVLPSESAHLQEEFMRQLFASGDPISSEGLHVNFHQKPFDTPLRYWNFVLNQGHFIEYFFNRINWYSAPQSKYVLPFPLHVDLESASTCNMSCPMCYRDQLDRTGQMEFDLFKEAVDECAQNNVFSIRLSWRGETLTHPRIKEMIAYATRKIKNVSFLTNAFYLEEDICDCLIQNQVNYVAVSFDGIEDTYEIIRHPAIFKDNYERLAKLLELRAKAGSKLPQIRLCTIWPAIKEDPDAYRNTMSDVSDYMVYNPYINFKGPMKFKTDFICQYPWERIVIGFDGMAQCCTGWNADDIILGNIRDISIARMWQSDQLDKIRQMHASGERMLLNSCSNCRHGSEGDADVEICDIIDRGY